MRTLLLITGLAAGLYCSCSSFRLERPIELSGSEWTMCGGGIERTNAVSRLPAPPLRCLWKYDVSAGSGSCGPSVADSLLFIGNFQGDIRIVRLTDGQEKSSRGFGSAIFGTPVIDHDTMYVVTSRDAVTVIAYILTTGKPKWQMKIGDVETSPLLMNGLLYITTYDGRLLCMDKSTGSVRWTFNVPKEQSRSRIIRSSPAGDGSKVVFGCDDGKVYALNAETGSLLWAASARASIVATPSISGGRVLVGSQDSTIYAVDLNSGTVVWKHSLGSRIYGSQAVSRSYAYVGTSAGTLFCLEAGTGKEVWSVRTGELLNTAPLVGDSTVYIGSADKKLYAFGAVTGEEQWSDTLEGRISAAPVAEDGFLLVVDDSHTLYGFQHSDNR
jgi:outer membrane protein assembly factor BamB